MKINVILITMTLMFVACANNKSEIKHATTGDQVIEYLIEEYGEESSQVNEMRHLRERRRNATSQHENYEINKDYMSFYRSVGADDLADSFSEDIKEYEEQHTEPSWVVSIWSGEDNYVSTAITLRRDHSFYYRISINATGETQSATGTWEYANGVIQGYNQYNELMFHARVDNSSRCLDMGGGLVLR